MRYVSGRKAGGFLTEYFNLAAAPFLDRYAYKTLTPQIKVGEAYDGQIVYALPEPRGANDKEEPCLLEEIRAVAEIETASVRGVKPGLARSDVIIFHPVVIVETPVSVFDRLNELADRLESEKRADMEFLSGRVYLAQFINYSRKLEMFMRRENVDAERKLEWMNQNHFLYNFFNSEPETAFEKIAGALDSVSAEKYKAAFLRAWASDVQRLDSMGIRETIIVVGHTVVTHSQLLDGWKKENRERRKADADHPADLVYGIIRKGVEIEGAPVQSPIVNVYSN